MAALINSMMDRGHLEKERGGEGRGEKRREMEMERWRDGEMWGDRWEEYLTVAKT